MSSHEYNHFYVYLLMHSMSAHRCSSASSSLVSCLIIIVIIIHLLGMRLCKAITSKSVNLAIAGKQYYNDGVDYYRESIPYIGRW